MSCALCRVRRPRRSCPGVRGEICTICCGREREVSVTCPLDCEHLREARRHDKPVPLDPAEVPHREIEVTEKFLADNEELLIFLGRTLGMAALETAGAADFDVRSALDALVRTYVTLESGVYYETRPDNALANRLYDAVREGVAEFRRSEQQRTGLPKTRDADVLGLLVFFERLELDRNNGRPRGRAFIDLLRGFYSEPAGVGETAKSRLVLP
jgi:hypothetical protein